MKEMTEKEELKFLLETLENDCLSQIHSLDETNDLSWSCYETDNWYAMLESIERLQVLTKTKLERVLEGKE